MSKNLVTAIHLGINKCCDGTLKASVFIHRKDGMHLYDRLSLTTFRKLQLLQAKLLWPENGLVLKQEWVGGALYDLIQFYDGSRHYERCSDAEGNPILKDGITLQEYWDAQEF